MVENNRIGVAGAAGSGKTTVANYLVDNHGFQILGFATPLYSLGAIHNQPKNEWHSRIYGWGYTYLEPLGFDDSQIFAFTGDAWDVMDSTEVFEGKNRTLLQLLGTEVGRAWDENLWTNIFEAKVEELGPDAKIVNDNLRFPNEMDSLERMGFVTVYLDLDADMRSDRYEQEYGVRMNEKQLSHASEAHLDEIRERSDFIYQNSGNLEELEGFLRLVLSGQLETNKELGVV